jgi:F-box-like
MPPEHSRFQQLPAEILLAIFEYLPRQTLQHLSLASRLTYNQASAILWRNLVLVDREHVHGDDVSQGLLSADCVHTELIGGLSLIIKWTALMC